MFRHRSIPSMAWDGVLRLGRTAKPRTVSYRKVITKPRIIRTQKVLPTPTRVRHVVVTSKTIQTRATTIYCQVSPASKILGMDSGGLSLRKTIGVASPLLQPSFRETHECRSMNSMQTVKPRKRPPRSAFTFENLLRSQGSWVQKRDKLSFKGELLAH